MPIYFNKSSFELLSKKQSFRYFYFFIASQLKTAIIKFYKRFIAYCKSLMTVLRKRFTKITFQFYLNSVFFFSETNLRKLALEERNRPVSALGLLQGTIICQTYFAKIQLREYKLSC